MPKRKRGAEKDPVQLRKDEVDQKLEYCRKLLLKALKLARGFERQKLGRRVKTLTRTSDQDGLKRSNKEIETLKTLDLSRTVDAHLRKSLLKSKSIADSPLLPSRVREIPKLSLQDGLLAFNNVTARMYNTKAVKDAMSQIMTMMYLALEIPEPGQRAKDKKEASKKGSKPRPAKALASAEKGPGGRNEDLDEKSEDQISWDGFGSAEGPQDDRNSDSSAFSFDEDQLSRYDACLGNSSDDDSAPSSPTNDDRESSFPLPSHPVQNPSASTKSLPISRSLSPTSKPTSIPKTSKAKAELAIPKGSVFLPSLMGGYWSGTESEASDNESLLAGPAPRKNRRGQQARRLIAEAKFGNRAKHLQAGNEGRPRRNGRDDREKDWDMRRGARPSSDGHRAPRQRKERDGVAGGRARSHIVTGENAVSLGTGISSDGKISGKKDDGKKGVNHPSWQAAKRAKQAVKTAAFQGSKVKFD